MLISSSIRKFGHKRWLALMMVLVFALGTAVFLPAKQAAAFTPNYNPSNLIDDRTFTDTGTMSVSSIQSFLTKEGSHLASYHSVEACDSTIAPYYSHCGSNISAAQTIYDAAHAYGINPRTILATMEKEQSLITDPSPSSSQINCAMGYNSCTNFVGFFTQVDNGTWVLRYNYEGALRDATWLKWSPGSNYPCSSAKSGFYSNGLYPNNTVTFADAGGKAKTITLANAATSSLYCYTPYVGPYSETGYSGSYNFVYYFQLWWGTTYGSPFFRVSGTSAVYITGANDTYYHVTSPSQMAEYGFGTKTSSIDAVTSSYLSGLTYAGNLSLVARFNGGDPVYLMGNKRSHYISSSALLNDYGYTSSDVSNLASWVYDYLNHSTNLQNVMKQSDASAIYYVSGGKKQHITSWNAYTTLGSPVYSSRSSVTLDSYTASQISTGAPIMTSGSLTKDTNDNTYGVWNGTALQAINSTVAKNTGLPAYSAPSSVIGQLPTGGSTLSSLAKSSAGNYYILDSGKKIAVNSSQLSNLGLSSGSFVTTSDDFLSKLPTKSLGTLFRVNSTNPVYDIVSGEIYHIPTSVDFHGLGYNFGNVLSVNQTTANLFTNNGADEFEQGRLVSVNGDPKVYLVEGTFSKMYIPSADIFNEYGFDWRGILQESDSSELGGYSTSGNLPDIVKDGSSNYWLVDSGVKHKVSSTMLSASYYNINTSSTPTLSSTALSRLSTSSDLTQYVRASDNTKVYGISNGQKHWYTSRTAFENAGGSFDQVIALSPAYIDSITTGSNIN